MKRSNRSPEQPICSAGETCYVTARDSDVYAVPEAVPEGDPWRAAPVIADSARALGASTISSKPLRIRTDE
jgi:hypothetical protein